MSEVRALLLTDVVDSTQLSERLGEAELAALWAAHDRLARDLLPVRRGREIDKTDGMLLLFEAAADAVAYAMAYQRAVAKLDPPLKARAGVHVGPVILRENSRSDVARGAKPLEVEGAATGSNWRAASRPARVSCRCWGSAARARRGWSRGSVGAGSETSPGVSGSAICRRPAARAALYTPSPRRSPFRWARRNRSPSSAMPSRRAADVWSFSTTSSRCRATPRKRWGDGSSARQRHASR